MKRSNILQQAIKDAFREEFKSDPDLLVQAPGRVNLIGEHTDYNEGFVLPCAIDFQVAVAVRKREDTMLHVTANDYNNQTDSFDLSKPINLHPEFLWANYIRGVTKFFIARGHELKGADIMVGGNVPQGAGLSSSAALEVAIGQAFKALADLKISQQEIAIIGQQAENEFVGCHCGIMDQLVSAKSLANHAMLIDCRNLESRAVKIPEDIAVVIINSNVQRGLVDSEYNKRRAQCEQATRFLGVESLREVDWETVNENFSKMDNVVARRARHVVSENRRTLAAASALQSSDMKTMGRLMAESHQSMKMDFEITVPPIDRLVEIVKQVIQDEGGVRMTGGGFGGCLVALFPKSLYQSVSKAITEHYFTSTGLHADIYICEATQGAGTIDA